MDESGEKCSAHHKGRSGSGSMETWKHFVVGGQ
jgi:hypothetical protein